MESPTPSEASDIPDLEEEEYEVDYIVQSRLKQYGKKVVLEYFIHWKNYPESERTWTLADQFEDDDPPVVAFYKKNPRAPRRGQSTPFSLLMGGNAKAATPKKAPAKSLKVTKATPKSTKAPASGKENRQVKKPRVAESEDEEFVPPEDDDVKDDEEDDDYDDHVASESDGPADEFDEEDEDSEPTKPAKPAKKTHGSWGVANKGSKKAAVKL